MKKRKIILIGWDAADWKLMNPLIDSGKMPALSKMIDNGCMGNISTLEPVISPILWTSIATGKTGDKHGILGFTETDEITKTILPSLSTSRKTKAIWNILQQNGYKTHQIGWWATYPPEKLNGISVSDLYAKPNIEKGVAQPSMLESVYPAEFKELFNLFRLTPFDIDGPLLLPFVPRAGEINQDKDRKLTHIAEAIAESSNCHSIATWILEHEEWDFLTLYLKSIDTLCHRFMKYHPPQLQEISDTEFNQYNQVIEGIYIFYDMMLERLIKLAGPEATIILVSDHGFKSGNQRLLANPKEPTAIAYDHRPYGVFCIMGPGIKKDERIFGASLLDVVPTILSACQIPIGNDMDGKPLQQVFETPHKISFVDSWDTIDGDSGIVSPRQTTIPKHFTTKEELQQLIDLGYIDDPGDDIKLAIENTNKESKFNLARIHMFSHQYQKAASLFKELSEDFPEEPRFKTRLASVYQRMGKTEKCQQVIDELNAMAAAQGHNTKKDAPKTKWKVPLHVVLFLEGNNLLAQDKPLKAIKIFEKLEDSMPSNPRINVQKARAYMSMLKYNSAQREYEKSLQKDNENIAAWVGLANCCLIDKKYEEAAEAALNAIGHSYFYPRAHLILGYALLNLHDYENAIHAFEVSLAQNPGLTSARNHLISIYKNHVENPEELQKHLDFIKNNSNNTVIIVSGIPRSGTSLMMQILKKAGYSILTDNKRNADINNPKGYFEYEQVKKLTQDNSWLDQARGKAVKIVSHLLFQLPDNFNYKIIFMNRDMKEIIHSQQKMISEMNGTKPNNAYPAHLEIAFRKNLDRVNKWEDLKSNVEIQYINYNLLIADPAKELLKISTFLDKKMDISNLKKVIDVNLYRSKTI
jgi:predicted AlkP superfamily phosphohydrolase/phosphomutase/tetratricopeptide (TPR) repeat protein